MNSSRLFDSHASFNQSFSWLGDRNLGNEFASSREGNDWRSVVNDRSFESSRSSNYDARLHYNDEMHYGGDSFGSSRNQASRNYDFDPYEQPRRATRQSNDWPASMLDTSTPRYTSTPSRREDHERPVASNYSREGINNVFNNAFGREREPTNGPMKFQRPKPLQDDIPVAEKYEKWLDWKSSFDVALSVCDARPTQMQKVGLLFTSVGPETQRTIRLLGLPPMHTGVELCGREYEELSRGLNAFFRGMVDESIDYNRFHGAKQEQGEAIHKYTLRLRGLATCINVTPSSFGFRHQLLKGMRDRNLAEKAADDNIPLGELIQIAARKEQREMTDNVKKTEMWQPVGSMQPIVATVNSNTREKGSRNLKRPANKWRDEEPGAKGKPCRYCGGRPHQGKKSCPAYGKNCLECGIPNHFAKVCEKTKKKQINNVEADRSDSAQKADDQVRDMRDYELY